MADIESIRQGNLQLERQNKRLTRRRNQIQTEKNEAIYELGKQRKQNKAELRQLKTIQDKQKKKVAEQGRQEVKDLKQMYQERKNSVIKHGTESINRLLSDTTDRIKVLDEHAVNKITKTNLENMTELQALTDKMQDPFYRPVTLPVQFQETDTMVEGKLKLPEHEAKYLQTFMDRDMLTFSLSRRSQTETQPAPGQVNRSARYQTVTEAFKVKGDVDTSKMTKHYVNGEVVVKIPKIVDNLEQKLNATKDIKMTQSGSAETSDQTAES